MLSSFIIVLVSNVGFEDVHLEVHLSGPDGCWWATSLVSGSGWLGFVVKLYIKALSWALWKNSFWAFDNKHFRKKHEKIVMFQIKSF